MAVTIICYRTNSHSQFTDEISNDTVVVVAVLDMRRNPAWIHGRLDEREK